MRHPRRLKNRACGAALGHRFIRFGKVLIGFQSYERQVTWQVRGIVKVLQIGRGWECLWERRGPREIPLQNPHARVYSLKNLACGALKFRSGAFSGLWVLLLALPIGTMAISTVSGFIQSPEQGGTASIRVPHFSDRESSRKCFLMM